MTEVKISLGFGVSPYKLQVQKYKGDTQQIKDANVGLSLRIQRVARRCFNEGNGKKKLAEIQAQILCELSDCIISK